MDDLERRQSMSFKLALNGYIPRCFRGSTEKVDQMINFQVALELNLYQLVLDPRQLLLLTRSKNDYAGLLLVASLADGFRKLLARRYISAASDNSSDVLVREQLAREVASLSDHYNSDEFVIGKCLVHQHRLSCCSLDRLDRRSNQRI